MKWILPILILASVMQQPAPAVDMNAVEKEFQQSMNNVIMVGHFTVGDSTTLHDDRYVIESVTKVKDGLWKFAARVQYNKRDIAVSLNVPVYFAGDTPVISLTRQAVQGMGMYDTRLVIYKGGYAGTWGGGTTGGKMFGNIIKNDASAAPKR
jgi:hypothetical protein